VIRDREAERILWMVLLATLSAVGVVGAVVELEGCGSSSSHIANTEKATKYEDELIACVDSAETLERSRACRCDVIRRWARIDKHPGCADGGTTP